MVAVVVVVAAVVVAGVIIVVIVVAFLYFYCLLVFHGVVSCLSLCRRRAEKVKKDIELKRQQERQQLEDLAKQAEER